uniref:Lipoprotein LPP20-like domain-containing protein n=1 Tax=uncultured bacterium contig00272 TaxID=1181619 RepID=A0A806K2Q4_9BACT|nr:hypothetical protein [uncultured bacterium contig00272]
MLARKLIFPLSLFAVLLCLPACANTSASSSKTAPEWVNSAEAVYPRAQYVAATGSAGDRNSAEKNAFTNLVSYFGITIQVDETLVSSYYEAVANGVVEGWTDVTEMKSTIRTAAEFENLLGAEIKEVWHDSKGNHYAVAVMEKGKSARLYNNTIQANLNIIRNLTNMTASEKNTLNGVVRYRFAATIADVNVYYANVVSLLDAVPPDGIIAGSRYRLEAQNIIKTIPVGIRISWDRQGRIFGAFAKCLSDLGFDGGSGVLGGATTSPRYVLNVDASLQPVQLPGNSDKFARIEIAANLTDTRGNLILLPYNFNSRQGHQSQSEAENRCIAAAERAINEEYSELLTNYLSRLIPKN